ncbi:MAG: hypothetical protein GX591_12260 [Planctomycetes bacterium]|nr:hypothetical protein [Planctomycetota bacterium]
MAKRKTAACRRVAVLVVLAGACGAASAAEVTFGANREMYVDGKLFLPVHAWAAATADLDRLKAMGVNLVLGFGDGSMTWRPISDESIAQMRRNLDECHKRGMYGAILVSAWWTDPAKRGSFADRTLADYIALFKDHPALLGWQISIEDDMGLGRAQREAMGAADRWVPRPGGNPEDLKARYQAVKQADPDHPVIIMHSGGQMIAGLRGFTWTQPTPETWYMQASRHCDILYHDLFPVANNTAEDLQQITDATRLLMKYGSGEKHLWVAVDAGDRKRWTTRSHAPTTAEIRCELWMALINGAHGLGFDFTSWKPTWASIRMDPQAEKQLGPEMATIQGLKEPILLGQTTRSVKVAADAPDSVQAIVRQYGGSLYVFAVNNEPQPRTAAITVSGLEAAAAAVLGEDRMVELRAGTFSDAFGGHQVHLYRIDPSPPGSRQGE